jgi:DNA helicase-2/ATP-dependent DNA helicase PcrA
MQSYSGKLVANPTRTYLKIANHYRRAINIGCSDAKDHLHSIVPQSFHAHQQRSNGDRHMYALRTRFIPDAITDRFEQCVWPPRTRESSSPAVAPLKTVPIGAGLKQMWR